MEDKFQKRNILCYDNSDKTLYININKKIFTTVILRNSGKFHKICEVFISSKSHDENYSHLIVR